ncbi:tyrosine-protein kinase receptor Tie-1-like [Haliotis rubra]|uniref:tyrosine-protein kinase receptor Tie-1-like n=1 Tax=Haliotis rubra TaxID=36100 RepID=UPI001EE6038C|nr:tyrosine-protein kinase receptor Tie-1-like [Haliotis rubra]
MCYCLTTCNARSPTLVWRGICPTLMATFTRLYRRGPSCALDGPRVSRDRIYTTKSDVWSYGILLWEIVTFGGSPYQGRSARQVVQDVLNGQTMSRPDHCAPELFSLMKKCWRQDPESRPDFDVLSRHLDTPLEESSNYMKLLDYQDHLYTILQKSSKKVMQKKNSDNFN